MPPVLVGFVGVSIGSRGAGFTGRLEVVGCVVEIIPDWVLIPGCTTGFV